MKKSNNLLKTAADPGFSQGGPENYLRACSPGRFENYVLGNDFQHFEGKFRRFDQTTPGSAPVKFIP